MNAKKGSGIWVQYAGAAGLLAFIGYGVFEAYNVPANILKLPAIQSETPSVEVASEPSVSETALVSEPSSDVKPEQTTSPVEVNEEAAETVETVPVEEDTTTVAETENSGESEIPVTVPEVVEEEPAIEDIQEAEIQPETDIVEETAEDQQEVAALETPLKEEPPQTDQDDEQLEIIASDSPTEPQFDLVRLDASGAGLVAGRADPGTKVRVLSNGIDVGTAEASASGEFVAFVQIPENDEGQSLSLEALGINENGERTSSTDQVLVLPTESDEEGEELAPTLVRASRENVRIIQPGGLGQISGVSLDSISYDESGDVILAGRGRGGDALRIYVDNDPTAEAVVSSGGTWEARFSSVEEGRYVQRDDALDASGAVSSRVESPFQRVYPTAEQLSAPSKITVQPGNSLWLMATERYGSGHLYTQIYAANEDTIRDPDLIYPGQIFEMPEVDAPQDDQQN